MTIRDERISATGVTNAENKIPIFRVKIARRTIITPNSMQYHKPILVQTVIQASPQLTKILSPNALYPPMQELNVLIHVRIPTDKNITLKRNQLFGLGYM